MTVLLSNVSIDTTSAEFSGNGGPTWIFIVGTSFGGGYVVIETALAGSGPGTGVWIPLQKPSTTTPPPDLLVDYNTVISTELPSGIKLRSRLVGSTGASGVSVVVLQ